MPRCPAEISSPLVDRPPAHRTAMARRAAIGRRSRWGTGHPDARDPAHGERLV